MKNKKFNYFILLIFTVLVLYFSLKDNFSEVTDYIVKLKKEQMVVGKVIYKDNKNDEGDSYV